MGAHRRQWKVADSDFHIKVATLNGLVLCMDVDGQHYSMHCWRCVAFNELLAEAKEK